MQQTIVFWRDIPSQVIVKRGREKGKVLLAERYQAAIDRAAMRAGKGGSDLYMEEWRREATKVESELPLQEYAAQVAQELEAGCDDELLKHMIKNKGFRDAQ